MFLHKSLSFIILALSSILLLYRLKNGFDLERVEVLSLLQVTFAMINVIKNTKQLVLVIFVVTINVIHFLRYDPNNSMLAVVFNFGILLVSLLCYLIPNVNVNAVNKVSDPTVMPESQNFVINEEDFEVYILDPNRTEQAEIESMLSLAKKSRSLLEVLDSLADENDEEEEEPLIPLPSILKNPNEVMQKCPKNISWDRNIKYRSKILDGSGVFRKVRLNRSDLNRIIKRIKEQENKPKVGEGDNTGVVRAIASSEENVDGIHGIDGICCVQIHSLPSADGKVLFIRRRGLQKIDDVRFP